MTQNDFRKLIGSILKERNLRFANNEFGPWKVVVGREIFNHLENIYDGDMSLRDRILRIDGFETVEFDQSIETLFYLKN